MIGNMQLKRGKEFLMNYKKEKQMQNEKMHVLVVIDNAMDVGGVQDVTMQLIRGLGDKVSFDVIVTKDTSGYYDEEVLKQGEIYRIIRRKHVNILKMIVDEISSYRKGKRIMTENCYNAIYCCNMFNASTFLKTAFHAQIPVRIAHSQTSIGNKVKLRSKILYGLKRIIINKYATIKLAVTKNAAKDLFGCADDVEIIKNPIIDVKKFQELAVDRKSDGTIRILHLGTLIERKNALFSVSVMNELVKINSAYRMTIAGGGDKNYRDRVAEMISSNDLDDYIDFVPDTVDLEKALLNSDYLILPSLSEGIPCVLLQAQAVGQACFVSTCVEPDSNQGLCVFIPLEKGCKEWANIIHEYYLKYGTERKAIDMSQWDSKSICELFLRRFSGLR